MVWPRARRNRARQPHTSTTADMTCDPARPTAWAISGQASSLRSTRTRARRRRCAHHGTARTAPPIARTLRQRRRERAEAAAAAASHPPTASVVTAAYRRSAQRGEPEPAAEREQCGCRQAGDAARKGHQCRWPACSQHASSRSDAGRDRAGRVRSGTATPSGGSARRRSRAAGRCRSMSIMGCMPQRRIRRAWRRILRGLVTARLRGCREPWACSSSRR